MTDFALTPPPSAWPLIFNFRAPILCDGFIARVELRGRLLARAEHDAVWLDGVNPGALALSAPSINTAGLELHSALTAVFVDFAEEHTSFDEFKAAVEQFFHDTDDDSVQEWQEAVSAVQQGLITAPAGLPVYPAGPCQRL